MAMGKVRKLKYKNILESGIELVHPYSRNKSDKEDSLCFILVFNSYGNNCEIDLSLPIKTFLHNIKLFKTKSSL